MQGVQHLRSLQEAGLTHVHLLPSFDFGSVPEREEDQLRIQVTACLTVRCVLRCAAEKAVLQLSLWHVIRQQSVDQAGRAEHAHVDGVM